MALICCVSQDKYREVSRTEVKNQMMGSHTRRDAVRAHHKRRGTVMDVMSVEGLARHASLGTLRTSALGINSSATEAEQTEGDHAPAPFILMPGDRLLMVIPATNLRSSSSRLCGRAAW